MGASLFIDTGALIARAEPADRDHGAARDGWRRVLAGDTRLFSSEPVLIESANFLARSQGCRFTADWLKRHVESAEIRWLQPGRDDIEEAMADMERFSDQRISFTDATSFALMRRHKIDRVFGFDRKFAAAGFALWPEGEK